MICYQPFSRILLSTFYCDFSISQFKDEFVLLLLLLEVVEVVEVVVFCIIIIIIIIAVIIISIYHC